jgi:hypothetical protein
MVAGVLNIRTSMCLSRESSIQDGKRGVYPARPSYEALTNGQCMQLPRLSCHTRSIYLAPMSSVGAGGISCMCEECCAKWWRSPRQGFSFRPMQRLRREPCGMEAMKIGRLRSTPRLFCPPLTQVRPTCQYCRSAMRSALPA